MEDQETKRISLNPSRSIISLKDIPPLDPSSIPSYSPPITPRTMTELVNVANQRFQEKSEWKLEEDNVRSSSFSNIQIDPNNTSSVNIKQEKKKDESKKGSAKLVLHELCISKQWKPPVYECCKVDGPSHMRLFTYKTVVEISDSSGTNVLECFGDPKRNKKAAAEHAAEGALWYLEHARLHQ